MRRTVGTSLGLVGLAALTLVGCSSKGSSNNTANQSPPASSTPSSSAPAATKSQDIAALIQQAVNKAKTTGLTYHMTGKLSDSQGEDLAMTGVFSAGASDFTLTGKNSDGKPINFEIRSFPNVEFLKGEGLGQAQFAGKWIKVPLTGSLANLGLGFLELVDPKKVLNSLGSDYTVTSLGGTSVHGQSAKLYLVTKKGEAGSARIAVDGAGHIVRLYGTNKDANGVTSNFDFQFFSFGTSVSVQQPPADQVVDLSNFIHSSPTP